MQYKIPLSIENEDEIVMWLSLRQLGIIGVHGGIAWGIFNLLEKQVGGTIALVFAIPVVIVGIIVALMKIAEMTFLPTLLNFIRLSLNGKERPWSQWTDSFSEIDIGFIAQPNVKLSTAQSKESFSAIASKDEELFNQIKNL